MKFNGQYQCHQLVVIRWNIVLSGGKTKKSIIIVCFYQLLEGKWVGCRWIYVQEEF